MSYYYRRFEVEYLDIPIRFKLELIDDNNPYVVHLHHFYNCAYDDIPKHVDRANHYVQSEKMIEHNKRLLNEQLKHLPFVLAVELLADYKLVLDNIE